MMHCEVAIIGGGPAGMAAALGAYEVGARSIVLLERDRFLGGILNQCIHSGFGLHRFKEELTGPEYASRDIQALAALNIDVSLETMVLDIGTDRVVTAVNASGGLIRLSAKAVVLAMGCRERPRAPVNIHGDRPAGIFTAGTAQRMVNIEGYMPGRSVVILGSGDIGLIMARRMRLEGAEVKLVAELMPYSGGLRRNIVQCLDDFDIPLRYNTTVVSASGRDRLRSVTLASVDNHRHPIPSSFEPVECDTLLLSVGLIPENELSAAAGVAMSSWTCGPEVGESLQTSIPGIFACGNVLHVHDLVDFVSEESLAAGASAARFAAGALFLAGGLEVIAGNGVRYTVPNRIQPANLRGPLPVRFRVDGVYKGAKLTVKAAGSVVKTVKKRIMTPGEMETLTLEPEALEVVPPGGGLLISVEEES